MKTPIETKAKSMRLKKWVYGTGVIICWMVFELFLKYSGIMLGGIPYGLLILFWLWMFSKAVGRNPWNWKKIETDEDAALMWGYGITKNEDGSYSYSNKTYNSYNEALEAARLDKYGVI